MPTQQPSSAPDATPPEPIDRPSAASVLHDEQMDDTPGGGGMGGQAAADPLGGSARGGTGTAPNAPIDTHTPGEAGAEREAQLRAVEDAVQDEGRGAGLRAR